MPKPNDPRPELSQQLKKQGGGAAFGGGANFQAQLTAIVGAHILRGKPLGWLEGICDDLPVAVWAESEGAGDDLRIELVDGTAIEVQAKKGLRRGPKLWTALLSLAKAIHDDQLAYGILAVASDTSDTIKEELARDIERLGQGRVDHLTEIGEEWRSRLALEGILASTICCSLRIRVVETLIAMDRDINGARDALRGVCEREQDASSAFDTLGHRALRLIENRGRWTLRDLVLLLNSRGIRLRCDGSPAALLDHHAKWVRSINSDYVIIGANERIPIEHLLPMQLEHRPFAPDEAVDVLSALERYQTIPKRPDRSKTFDSVWTARFKRKAVVGAGPGLGKSTMLRELAHQYAQDGFTVLSAPLKWIAAGMNTGKTFFELLVTSSFDSSGVVASDIIHDKRFNWVVLLDALDECGQDQKSIAEAIRSFSLGHPHARIVVTTRPIGYTSNALMDWQHYNLLPPEDANDCLEKLLSVIAPDRSCFPLFPVSYGGRYAPTSGFGVSPQLLGMSAVLIKRGRALPDTRAKLYSELIKLFEEMEIKARTVDGADLTDIAILVLNWIGWFVFDDPLQPYEKLVTRVAEEITPQIDKGAYISKSYVRASLEHWERLGLIETVYHDSTRLLTFIHKTFCEFLAARHLSQQSQVAVEQAIAQENMHELVNFGVALGLADTLIDIHLHRHSKGEAGQLISLLQLLSKPEVVISTGHLQRLTHSAFVAIDEGGAETLAMGATLSNVSVQASAIVSAEAERRRESGNHAIKLVAWALSADIGASADSVAAALNELAEDVAPHDLRMHLGKIKNARYDLELLRRIALSALRAQPSSEARNFAERELRDRVFSNVDFLLQINGHLQSRGLERLPTALDLPGNEPAKVIAAFADPGFNKASMDAILTIAKAFVPRDDSAPRNLAHDRAFPQFTGFLRASGYMETPFSDTFNWGTDSEEIDASSTLRYVASLLPLEQNTLEEECCELLALNAQEQQSFFEILTHVDIPELVFEKDRPTPNALSEIKQSILHRSDWLSLLATRICEPFPMSLEELVLLLFQAKSYSLHYVLYLIELNHGDVVFKLAWSRLLLDQTGDVSAIFTLFTRAEVKPLPSLQDVTLECLRSNQKETVRAATKLLQHWQEKGVTFDTVKLEAAVSHWGGREKALEVSSWNTPLYSIIELADKATDQSPLG